MRSRSCSGHRQSQSISLALQTAAIEQLNADDHRTIVIYQHAIHMGIATEGEAIAA